MSLHRFFGSAARDSLLKPFTVRPPTWIDHGERSGSGLWMNRGLWMKGRP
ncbi:hypothetical protein [Mycobacterium antarcticum]|nr:hypothetical protein [Mycolicibacterium sp. TUM20985]